MRHQHTLREVLALQMKATKPASEPLMTEATRQRLKQAIEQFKPKGGEHTNE